MRPDRADAGGAGEDHPLALGQRGGIEGREGLGHGARNVAGGEFMRLAHIDQHERAFAKPLLDGLAVEIDDLSALHS